MNNENFKIINTGKTTDILDFDEEGSELLEEDVNTHLKWSEINELIEHYGFA